MPTLSSGSPIRNIGLFAFSTAILLLLVCFGDEPRIFRAAAQEPPSAPVAKQSAGPPPAAATSQSDTQAKITSNVNLVVVPVTVKDGVGRLVPDLTQEEFRIFDDDVEQHIDVFSVEAFPLSVVVLLDNDLKQKDADQVQASLRAILGGFSNADEASICRFDTYFHPDQGFSHDQDKLLVELKRTKIDSNDNQRTSTGPAGGPFNGPSLNGGQSVTGGPAIAQSTTILGDRSSKAIDDGVYGAAELLAGRGRDRRKVILLISDGVNSKLNNHTYEVTLKELLRSGITVYSVGVGQGVLNRKFTRLQSYANDTGGDVFYAAKTNSLEGAYSRVTEQARNTYTLGYVPRGNNKTKEYHTIEVRVRRPDLSIHTREGYYSNAPR